MREFLTGLLVIVMMGAVWLLGILLLPLLLVLGIFLRLILGFVLAIVFVWLIGKATLFLIETLKKRSL